MDKLARQLHHDAERIDATVSGELDRRIEASLRGVTPEREQLHSAGPGRPPLFWWASAITGTAAAITVIALLNWQTPDEPVAVPPLDIVAAAPIIDWKMETAMLTSPLQEELDRLEADLKKAEEKVRQDIGL